jgi:sodium transport system permease protein
MSWRVVCLKEVLENARDRRTLLSTLVFGPIFGPVLFAVLLNVVLAQTFAVLDDTVRVPIVGAERAPNLVAFLAARGIRTVEEHALADVEDAADAAAAGEHDLIIVIAEDFGAHLEASRSARVTLVFDQSNRRAGSRIQRAQSALGAYGELIRAQRLLARGLDPIAARPLMVDQLDVSTPAGRAGMLLGVLTYFLLFATLMGGYYLAIDTTAGERERKSLEPLLTMPVTRATLLAGKMAATVIYMLLSLALTLVSFTVALAFVSLESMGMSATFDAGTAFKVFAVLAPFAPLGAALMILVASFTKSYKEAQTYLGVLLVVPTLPLIFAMLLNVEASAALMLVPSLSQHLLTTTLIRQEAIDAGYVALSAGSTLLAGALLAWIATKLYQREGLLG